MKEKYIDTILKGEDIQLQVENYIGHLEKDIYVLYHQYTLLVQFNGGWKY
jgi:hypothetical protein